MVNPANRITAYELVTLSWTKGQSDDADGNRQNVLELMRAFAKEQADKEEKVIGCVKSLVFFFGV